MRLYAIPDIHGRYDLLEKLLDMLLTQHNLDLSVDKLIFLGDYVDRGPDSFKVLDKIYKLTLLHPQNVIALPGNHEWMLINYYVRRSPDDIQLFEDNGGLQTIESFKFAGYSWCPDYMLRWLAFLPFSHTEPGFFFSHAPAPKDVFRKAHLQGQPYSPDELLWTFARDEELVAADHGNGIVGVCGHVHAYKRGIFQPRFYNHYIYTDSGCGCNSKAPLVAVEVKSREVISAWP